MANVKATAKVSPAGSVPPVGSLDKGAHALKILKAEPDGGRPGPYAELNKLYNSQFVRDENGKVLGLRDGLKKEETRLELYNKHFAKGEALESEDQLPTEHGERTYVCIEFPDKFSKTFQAKDAAGLVPQLEGQLLGRFGAEVKFLEVPSSLKAGEVFEIEVL